MKKIIAVLLSTVICFSILIGCVPFSKKEQSGIISQVEVTIDAADDATQIIRLATADSVNSYIVARMYLEEFLEYDIDAGNLDEYSNLLDKTIKAFESAGTLSESLMAATDVYEEDSIDVEYDVIDCAAQFDKNESSIFSNIVYADEKSDAVKWAEDLTKRFDEAPYGKGIRTLAEQLNTDTQKAYAQLRMAQDILAGAAYEDFADAANNAYQTAKVLKTAGTTAGFVISIATSGGATGIAAVMEGGGIIMNGINTALEVGQTASMFVIGDDSKTTLALEDIENRLAPISSVIGLYGVTTASYGESVNVDLCNAVTYIAGSIYDYCSDGKMLGGTFTENAKGEVEFTLVETILGTKDEKTIENTEALCKAIGIKTSVINDATNTFEDGDGIYMHEVTLDEASDFIGDNESCDPNSNDFDAIALMDELLKELEETTGDTITTTESTEETTEATDETSESTAVETTGETSATTESTEETTEVTTSETIVSDPTTANTVGPISAYEVPVEEIVGKYELFGSSHETEGVDYSELGENETVSCGFITVSVVGTDIAIYYEFEGAEHIFTYDSATGTASYTDEYGLSYQYVFDGAGNFTGIAYDSDYIYYDYEGIRVD
ncbi:MAG: hypothetical protein MJ153_07990 [Clostridia bacterium]|nr:hypothetical protein [Clostridia bacterium]